MAPKCHDTNHLRSFFDLWWIKALGGLLFTLLRPDWKLLVASILLMTIDFVTGIIAARRRGEKITSWGFQRTMEKSLLYFCFIAAITIGCNAHDAPGLAAWGYGFVNMTEMKSITENVWGSKASQVWRKLRAVWGRGGEEEKETSA